MVTKAQSLSGWILDTNQSFEQKDRLTKSNIKIRQGKLA